MGTFLSTTQRTWRPRASTSTEVEPKLLKALHLSRPSLKTSSLVRKRSLQVGPALSGLKRTRIAPL